MRQLISRIVLILATTTVPVFAASVTTIVHGEEASAESTVLLRATAESRPILERRLRVPGVERVDLDAGVQLSIESKQFWASPVVLSDGGDVRLDLWPRATITGTLRFDGPRATPSTLNLRFGSIGSDRSSVNAASGDSACTIAGERFRCDLAAGTHDLRFSAPEHISEFRWSIKVGGSAPHDIGVLTLRRGASLHGFVTVRRGLSVDLKEVRVTAIAPTGTGIANTVYSAAPNARGFFQIAGLPPGDYVVTATAKRVRSALRSVRVIAFKNAELRDPLVLDNPKKITVRVTPPLDRDGRNWRVGLDRIQGRTAEDIGGGIIDRGGKWEREAVAGEYDLRITRFDGSVWQRRRVLLDDQDVTLDLSLAAKAIRGTLTLGKTPLAATLDMSTSQGVHQTLVTDADGHFAGELPSFVTSTPWDITVKSEAPPIERTLRGRTPEPSRDAEGELNLNLDLPRTLLSGRVIDSTGTPQANAIVSIHADDFRSEGPRHVFTENDGTFECIGSEPGKYRVQADVFQKSSEIMTVEIGDDTPPLEIVVKPETRVIGRVINGLMPITGAEVYAFPKDVPFVALPSGRTDENGAFSIGLPAGTQAYDAVVSPLGFAFTMGRVVVRDDKRVQIGVDQYGGELIIDVPSRNGARLAHLGADISLTFFEQSPGVTIEQNDNHVTTRIASVEQGEYTVCFAGTCKSGVVAPHGSLTLSVK